MAPGKSPISREERLRRMRVKERERYARIKNDPAQWKLRQESVAENYARRKVTLKVKMVSQMSNRELRAKRKEWRENTKSHRATKKSREAEARYMRENSPASSDCDDVPQVPQVPVEADRRKTSGRKKVKRDRAKMSRENKKLREENEKLKRSLERERKRMYRYKKSQGKTDSPNTKVNEIMKKGKYVIRQKLLFGETLAQDLNDTYKNIKSHKNKKVFRTFVVGNAKFAWKYKLLNKFRVLNESLFRKRTISNDPRKVAQSRLLAKKVEGDIISFYFYEQDDVSRISPGKKDVIVRKKVKKQKRFLSQPFKELHKRFCGTHDYKISLSTFCKLRPFLGPYSHCCKQRHLQMHDT